MRVKLRLIIDRIIPTYVHARGFGLYFQKVAKGRHLSINRGHRPNWGKKTKTIMDKKKQMEVFKAADTDGDGQLDLDEYINHYKSQGVNISREDARLLYKDKDKDMDGKISFDEFTGKQTETEKAWNAIDSNRNGYVTRNEMVQALRKYKKSLPKVLTDANGEKFVKL